MPPYIILGACNPSLAHQALSLEPQIGLLLPCNVVVQQTQDGEVVASIADPRAMFAMVDNARIAPIVDDAERRLRRVIRMSRLEMVDEARSRRDRLRRHHCRQWRVRSGARDAIAQLRCMASRLCS